MENWVGVTLNQLYYEKFLETLRKGLKKEATAVGKWLPCISTHSTLSEALFVPENSSQSSTTLPIHLI